MQVTKPVLRSQSAISRQNGVATGARGKIRNVIETDGNMISLSVFTIKIMSHKMTFSMYQFAILLASRNQELLNNGTDQSYFQNN